MQHHDHPLDGSQRQQSHEPSSLKKHAPMGESRLLALLLLLLLLLAPPCSPMMAASSTFVQDSAAIHWRIVISSHGCREAVGWVKEHLLQQAKAGLECVELALGISPRPIYALMFDQIDEVRSMFAGPAHHKKQKRLKKKKKTPCSQIGLGVWTLIHACLKHACVCCRCHGSSPQFWACTQRRHLLLYCK
jgi:hypothetical protein